MVAKTAIVPTMCTIEPWVPALTRATATAPDPNWIVPSSEDAVPAVGP